MDAVEEWTDAQRRVTELLAPLGPDDAERKVPACPDWTVRDLLAHMVGLDADVLAGEEEDEHSATWTQGHVDARAGQGIPVILDEWRAMVPDMRAYLAEEARPLGDAIIHEQDLRGALGRPGGRDTAGLAAIRERMAGMLADRVGGGQGPLRLRAEDWDFVSGDGDPGLVLEASGFDLARAVMSRRSASQLAAWVVDGDLDAYLEAFEVLGPLPDAPLTE